MFAVECAGADVLPRVRAIRLRALSDTPDAFGATYAEDLAMSDDQWLKQLTDPQAIFLAVEDAGDIGLAIGLKHWTHITIHERALLLVT